jgi:hypothetical protein
MTTDTNTTGKAPFGELGLRGAQASRRRDHYGESGDTNRRVRRLKGQFVLCCIVMWVACTLVGKGTSGRYWFESGNEAWLWHTHNLGVALLEDDPKFLEIRCPSRGDSCWEFFIKSSTTKRMDMFVRIVFDGEHPNLVKWASDNAPDLVNQL